MDLDAVLQTSETLLQPLAESMNRPEPNRLDVVVIPEHLVEAVKILVDNHWGYLATISGLDHPAAVEEGAEPDGMLEAMYHFCEGPVVTSLRVSVPYANPIIPTICELVPVATLFERELMELFGIVCEGTPTTDHLILPEGWPEGVYPLRKSFTGFSQS